MKSLLIYTKNQDEIRKKIVDGLLSVAINFTQHQVGSLKEPTFYHNNLEYHGDAILCLIEKEKEIVKNKKCNLCEQYDHRWYETVIFGRFYERRTHYCKITGKYINGTIPTARYCDNFKKNQN